jgi:acetyltransferase-like isoleucine patch superfamily enzyme
MGDHVTITGGVRFVTHDGGVWVFREEHPEIDVIAPITLGNNVFVGLNTIIMPGVTIGSNVVIGAGSVVTRSIPSNTVAAGVPAKVIRPLDDYKANVLQKALFIRSQPLAVKRKTLTSKFKDHKASDE